MEWNGMEWKGREMLFIAVDQEDDVNNNDYVQQNGRGDVEQDVKMKRNKKLCPCSPTHQVCRCRTGDRSDNTSRYMRSSRQRVGQTRACCTSPACLRTDTLQSPSSRLHSLDTRPLR